MSAYETFEDKKSGGGKGLGFVFPCWRQVTIDLRDELNLCNPIKAFYELAHLIIIYLFIYLFIN